MLHRSLRNVSKIHDYVVIGAGSAGNVLAHRLVKEYGASVLLIEAGGSNRGSWDSWQVQMPASLTFNIARKKRNWDFFTVPQKHLDHRRMHQPRGKVLGGSSAINAMAYVRGSPFDYERWADEIGDESWSYSHVLPYFKKAQCHQLGENIYRGGHGPLSVTRRHTQVVAPINKAFIRAGMQAGYPYTDDQNGYKQEGFGWMDMTVSTEGVRASTSESYLWPLLNGGASSGSGSLDVLIHTHVHHISFDGQRAVGVEVMDRRGKVTLLKAKEEVILSAGAVGSPVILNRSGVGDPNDLEQHGIKVHHALPEVGKNLQDHLEFYVQYLSKKDCSLYPYAATFGGFGHLSMYLYRQPWKSIPAGIRWFIDGGFICGSNNFEVGGFIRSTPEKKHPDVQYHFIPGAVTGQLDFLPRHAYQAHAGTMRPSSRGTLRISSSDPSAPPLIDPNFCATSEDVIDHRETLRRTIEIMEQDAFMEFAEDRLSPDPKLDITNDDDVDAWVRKNSHSGYHLCCTCAMGKVVDSQGRVFGLEGLRVVDASIMPSITSGNLNAPTIMMAEKIADMMRGVALPPVKADWYNHETDQVQN